MAISNEQFNIWAKAPDPEEMKRIKQTHEKVREVIDKFLPKEEIKRNYNLWWFDYEIYLQGSYANSTNISFNSDVDIVLQLNSVFRRDITRLNEVEVNEYKKHFSSVSYKFLQWKEDTLTALQKWFWTWAKENKKCIEIDNVGFWIKADVVPCFEYRKYKRFPSLQWSEYVPWIHFYSVDGDNLEDIYSFPKPHINSCTIKNKYTDWKFKDMVRIFKNLSVILEKEWVIGDKDACGYHIENMLYNCREICYEWTYTEIFLNILNNVHDDNEKWILASYECANEEDLLFKGGWWELEKALNFVQQCYLYYTK